MTSLSQQVKPDVKALVPKKFTAEPKCALCLSCLPFARQPHAAHQCTAGAPLVHHWRSIGSTPWPSIRALQEHHHYILMSAPQEPMSSFLVQHCCTFGLASVCCASTISSVKHRESTAGASSVHSWPNICPHLAWHQCIAGAPLSHPWPSWAQRRSAISSFLAQHKCTPWRKHSEHEAAKGKASALGHILECAHAPLHFFAPSRT